MCDQNCDCCDRSYVEGFCDGLVLGYEAGYDQGVHDARWNLFGFSAATLRATREFHDELRRQDREKLDAQLRSLR
jgi:hypothetical protein